MVEISLARFCYFSLTVSLKPFQFQLTLEPRMNVKCNETCAPKVNIGLKKLKTKAYIDFVLLLESAVKTKNSPFGIIEFH